MQRTTEEWAELNRGVSPEETEEVSRYVTGMTKEEREAACLDHDETMSKISEMAKLCKEVVTIELVSWKVLAIYLNEKWGRDRDGLSIGGLPPMCKGFPAEHSARSLEQAGGSSGVN